MTAAELARVVLTVLDAQQRYFRSRSREDLIASKQLERDLRVRCDELIAESSRPAHLRDPKTWTVDEQWDMYEAGVTDDRPLEPRP